MIGFKTWSALDQYRDLHASMRDLLEWVYRYAWPVEVSLVVTRIADPASGQVTAIHTQGPPHRAVDVRVSSIPSRDARRVEAAVNAMWIYDPARPDKKCALLHDAGSGMHLHLQVHNMTRPTVTI